MQYLLLIYEEEKRFTSQPKKDFDAELAEYRGVGDEFRRQHDASLLVRFHRASIAEQCHDEIVVLRAELVVALQRRAEGFETFLRPAFDARKLMRWTQHQRRNGRRLAGVTHLLQHGAKLRGNRHTPFGVQLVLVRADELGHPDPPAFPALRFFGG